MKLLFIACVIASATVASASDLKITDSCLQSLGKVAADVANKKLSDDKYVYIGNVEYKGHGTFEVPLYAEDCDDVETFTVKARMNGTDCEAQEASFQSGGGSVSLSCNDLPRVR